MPLFTSVRARDDDLDGDSDSIIDRKKMSEDHADQNAWNRIGRWTVMSVFKAIPDDLFSVLASPNRVLYADALEILYQVYRESLKISEDTFYSALRENLENELAEAPLDEEDIGEEESKSVSGRARFLIRKLYSKGWFEKERGQDLQEYLTIPEYSSRILELLHSLSETTMPRGDSLVFGTYSTLKVANEEGSPYQKMSAVYSAWENTHELIKLLKTVYHNIRHYFQVQVEMQDINLVLAAHYDDFGPKVMEAYIRPLKIKDSVPKYRVSIQNILDTWLEDGELFVSMADAAFRDDRGSNIQECRSDLRSKIFWIKDSYDSLESGYLNEIDLQVRRYTRAARQKVENLTNRDQNVRGDLHFLLDAISNDPKSLELLEMIQPVFQLLEQGCLTEKSLWDRKRGVRRIAVDPVTVEIDGMPEDMESDLLGLTRSKFGKTAVRAYMSSLMEKREILSAEDLDIPNDDAYVMAMLGVVNSSDQDSPYTVGPEEALNIVSDNRRKSKIDSDLQGLAEETIQKGPYRIPRFQFRKKAGRQA